MAKTVNYTPEMTATMIEMYTSVIDTDDDRRAAMVKEIADTLGKQERSVRAKLSREGVYIPKTPVSKITGQKAEKKDALAERLAEVSGAALNVENLSQLTKLNLVRLIEAFEKE